jgi:hypothetical protein
MSSNKKTLKTKIPMIPFAVVLVIIGVVFLLTSAFGLLVGFRAFVNSGHLVTTPASLTFDLQPGQDCAVYQSLTGTHATLNNPVAVLPDNLQIVLNDPQTNAPIATQDANWISNFGLLGENIRRRAVRSFKAPSSGKVQIDISGIQPGQVFYVGPTNGVFQANSLPRYITEISISMLIILVGMSIIFRKLASTSIDDAFTNAAGNRPGS